MNIGDLKRMIADMPDDAEVTTWDYESAGHFDCDATNAIQQAVVLRDSDGLLEFVLIEDFVGQPSDADFAAGGFEVVSHPV